MAEFINEKYTNDWLVQTNDRFKSFRGIGQTIEYQIWDVYTTNYHLQCADNHILIQVIDNGLYKETYVKDLIVGDNILVIDDDGNSTTDMIMVVYETDNQSVMYDLLDVEDSLYTTSSILSHNSTTTICYALYTILFKSHQNLAILANKRDLAMELLGRLQLAYENLPLWLQQGVLEWNKSHIELENGSQIMASSTSATSVRGSTFNIVFCDEFAFVPNSIQEEFMTSVYPTISSSKDSKLIITSCVTKDTFILTNKGYTQIATLIKDELEKKSYYVPKYEVIGMKDNNKGSVICNNGKTDIRKIYTSINQTNCSTVHKFYACKNGNYGWYMASELEKDDFIAVKYNTQIFGDEDLTDSELFPVITPEFAYFFGIYCGSGYITDDRFITLALRDSNTGVFENDRYNDAIEDIGIDYDFDGKHYVIDCPELARLLKTLKNKNPNKYANYGSGLTELPMRWSKQNIISLLQGCFDSMALYNYTQDKLVYGDIYINTINEDLVEQLHVLLLNLGVINNLKTGMWEAHRYYWHTTRKMRYTPRSCLKISNCYSPDFFDIVGFRQSHKQTWKLYQINIRKFRKKGDLIPFFIPFLKKHLTVDQCKKYIKQVQAFLPENETKFVHMSRANALSRINMLRGFSNKKVNEFVDIHLRSDITWTKIYKIVDGSQDYVYDLSLNNVDNDKWCHSVLYNGNVGHNTPRGLNLFYKLYTQAVQGNNEYVPVEISWRDIPGRDEEFKRVTISNTSERQFEQEFESSASSTIVRIQDLEGKDREVTLGELYELLREQNILEQEGGIINIMSESVD